jgi:hypothetical protein
LPEVSYIDSNDEGALAIDVVKYYNNSNPVEIIVLDDSNYSYDPTGNKVILPNGMPQAINLNVTSPIIIEYTVNPNLLSAYPVIKQAALLLLTHLYNNRSETTLSKLQNIPYGVDALLRPYKPLVM